MNRDELLRVATAIYVGFQRPGQEAIDKAVVEAKALVRAVDEACHGPAHTHQMVEGEDLPPCYDAASNRVTLIAISPKDASSWCPEVRALVEAARDMPSMGAFINGPGKALQDALRPFKESSDA